jgi:hypothetical protein
VNWKCRINIKQYFGEGEDIAAIKQANAGIKRELEKLPMRLRAAVPQKFYLRMDQAVKMEDVEIFNLGLETLYDWADEAGVWMG